MKPRHLRSTLAALALALVGSVWATGVGMSNTWLDLSMTKAKCIQQATAAIKKAGFTSNFDAANESVYADQDAYTVLVRCVADKKVVYLVVAGPDSDLADKYLTSVEKAFDGK
ncbi:hypothetical protein [Deinococcus sp.]|uniref:hypothetical protein n=1 Tax=Deinococcus sp. TaxID=47478 RepID=UPI003CC6C8FB